MSAAQRTLLLAAKALLIAGLLCGMAFAQAGYTQPPAGSCAAETRADAPAVSCQHCCAAMPCCLVSKHAPDAPSRPEPLNNERNPHLDHAPAAMMLALVSAFDFLAPPQKSGILAGDRFIRRARGGVPRAAVSCIWLI